MAGTYNDQISRQDAAELIPTQEAASILKLVQDYSGATRLFRQVRMSTKTYRQPVLASLPVAYWVSGDTGLKQTTTMSWDGIDLIAEELATILPIPEAVLDDAGYPIWDEAGPLLAQAIAKKLDQAIFPGLDKPNTWPEAIIPGAVAADNAVQVGSTPDEGGIANDIDLTFQAVEDDGYDVNGIVGKRAVRGLLRRARDTTGQKLLDVTANSIEGIQLAVVPNDALDAATLLVVGDYSMGLLGVRQDLTWKMLDQSVISDDAGKVILNLAQQDAVALRVVARYGFAVANPVIDETVTDPYPFAVLQGVATLAATAKTSTKTSSSS
jgi:HK97 family phage major capsid protein